MDFFLKSEQYLGFELLEHFMFSEVQNSVREIVITTFTEKRHILTYTIDKKNAKSPRSTSSLPACGR